MSSARNLCRCSCCTVAYILSPFSPALFLSPSLSSHLTCYLSPYKVPINGKFTVCPIGGGGCVASCRGGWGGHGALPLMCVDLHGG